ncbi:GNAT family N-acetyltransferase [Taibaiella soli]|uniref:GNAT family N-acetyltransferase n=1 Tax=Taibaiella soli TaxID=1649169 RepID=A0A2W2AZ16_9BACT|nr:GNAT family N-acetyltransferase [Taibaiella soli]PZF72908.1 GNAT family N-acetyltransferase [Taibaiella soli]
MAVTFKQITTSDPLFTQVWQLREDVLRRPLGLSLQDEDLSNEADETIFVGVEDDRVIGCVMVKKLDDVAKVRQMAIAAEMQGGGIGRLLMTEAEDWIWENGFKKISLHARVSAATFYEKLGYEVVGDVFTEVNIPHVKMEKLRP